jgi:anti-sigma regulatory factor (Ser/Thr protein kinase)
MRPIGHEENDFLQCLVPEQRNPVRVSVMPRMNGLGRTPFRHEAVLYQGPEEFRNAILPLILSYLPGPASILVAVDPDKGAHLRSELGKDAALVQFVDMRSLGRNPARIIPLWRSFVAEHAWEGRMTLGVSEPVWPGRSPSELEECELHESLLHRAFSGGPPWRLMCPYDVANLPPEAVRAAFETHPAVPGFSARATDFREPTGLPERFQTPLEEPTVPFHETRFESAESLAGLRRLVVRWATAAGAKPERAADIALAVSEVAANSVRHGGGGGTLRVWTVADMLVLEVRDRGRIDDPLVGRTAPDPVGIGHRGLWIANQLCDLVQIRSLHDGVVVRLHANLALDPDTGSASDGVGLTA